MASDMERDPAGGQDVVQSGAGPSSSSVPEAPPPSLDDEGALSPDRLREILNFDPFLVGGDGGSREVAPVEQPAPSARETEPPASQPGEDPRDQELADLRRQVAEARQYQPPQQPAQPQQMGQGTPKELPLPPYQFTIPAQLLAMLRSEDEGQFREGLNLTLTGIAQSVHKTIRHEVEARERALMKAVNQFVQNSIRTGIAQREIAKDFYTQYPMLDRPGIRQTVATVVRDVWNEKRYQNWNSEWRDETARRVAALTGVPLTQPTPAPTTTKAPARFSPGARPAPVQKSAFDQEWDGLF